MKPPIKNRCHWNGESPKRLCLYRVYRLWGDGNKNLVGITDNVDKWLEHVNEDNKTNESLDAFEIKAINADIYDEGSLNNAPKVQGVSDE
tara:strand:- start:1518 stop:1787 length:270 start_codon:yes stop_codon:yes gene_type:complete